MGSTGTLITYKVISDHDDKLKAAARLACNFWNHFIEPKHSVVIHVGLWRFPFGAIARACPPELKNGVLHGRIEFNKRFLDADTELRTAGNMVHEIGHTLGIGWNRWQSQFDAESGVFKQTAIELVPALADMEVETDLGAASDLMHWDEDKHKGELMTGQANAVEHVLPVTIDVMELLGHHVARRLLGPANLGNLLREIRDIPFTRHAQAKALAAVDFEFTTVWETIGRRAGAAAQRTKRKVMSKRGKR